MSFPEQDRADLGRFGYAQELFRGMGGFSNFAISFSIISILTGAVTLFGGGRLCRRIESREPVVALCSPAEVSPAVVQAFAHAPGDKAYLFPLTVDQSKSACY